MALSKTTRDHDEIQQWAERRGALPAEVASTHSKGEPGILRFMFPKAKNHNDSSLREIGWDEFFEKFDENDLELVYQEVTAEGAESNFNKLVHPSEDEHSSRKGKSSSGSGSSSKTSQSASHSGGSSRSASKSSSAGKASAGSKQTKSANGTKGKESSGSSAKSTSSSGSAKAKGASGKSSETQGRSSGSKRSAA